MDNPKILLSDATSYKAVVAVAFLKKTYPAVEIYTCDSRSASRFFHTKYTDNHIVLKHKITNKSNYRDEILDIIDRYAINIFIPVNSREMEIFLSHRSGFETALSYWGDYEAFKVLNEKDRLYKLCGEVGIKTPQIFEDVENIIFPVVIKPKVASAAKGVSYILNINEYRRYLKTNTDMTKKVIQQYIKGVGVGYSVFAVDGKIKVGCGHKRLAEYPVNGGSSMYRTSFNDERMVDIAQKLLDAAKWSGFAMFEFKLTENNELYLIEVNPRIWGSINHGLQNGINYFANLLGDVPSVKREDVNTYFSPFVYLSFLLYLFNGNPKPLFTFLSDIFKNKADINLFDDPYGWFGSLLRLI